MNYRHALQLLIIVLVLVLGIAFFGWPESKVPAREAIDEVALVATAKPEVSSVPPPIDRWKDSAPSCPDEAVSSPQEIEAIQALVVGLKEHLTTHHADVSTLTGWLRTCDADRRRLHAVIDAARYKVKP